jgi:hypothetical protein
MFAASAYQQRAGALGTTTFIAVDSVLVVCGFVMAYKAYVTRGR